MLGGGYMASNFLLYFCLVLGVTISETTVQPSESPPTSYELTGTNEIQSDDPSLQTRSLGAATPRSGGEAPFGAAAAPPNGANSTMMQFTVEPTSLLVRNGEPAELRCAVNVDGVTIQWLYKGKPVTTGKRKFVRQSDGSLVFKKVKRNRQDDGTYQCKVLKDYGAMLSRPAKLSIASIAREFRVSPGNASVPAGGVALLRCALDSVPPARIVWQRDGRPLDVNGSDRHAADLAGSLVIRPVTADDEGAYSCVGYNDVAGRQRRSGAGWLQVSPAEAERRPPAWLVPPPAGTVNVTAGGSLMLPCVADGSPPPDITWSRKDGVPIPSSAVTVGSSLHLVNVTRDRDDGSRGDNATYICRAKNAAGELVQETTVDVLVPPVLTSPATPLLELGTARVLRLPCKADGVPKPTVTWIKDGQRVTAGGGRVRVKDNGEDSGELVIGNLRTSDAGVYQCMAYSRAGYAAAAVRLAVTRGQQAGAALVEPPWGLRATEITSRSARIAWNVTNPKDNLAYSLHYRVTNEADQSEAQEVLLSTSMTLTELRPYTNYTAYVRAYSQFTASDPSDPLTFVTDEDVPSQTPRVTLVAISPTALNVSWEPLPPELSNGVITGYRINCQRHNDPNSATMVEVNGQRHSVLLTGLEPGRTYDVRVQAATRVGYQNLTSDGVGDMQWVRQRMPEASSTSVSRAPRPPAVQLVVTNHTTIRITWEITDDGQSPRPIAFNVLYRRQEQSAELEGPIRLSADTSQHYLTGLVPNTWYEVHVEAVAADGQTAESIKTISTLPAEPPGQSVLDIPTLLEPPLELRAEVLNSSAVRVSWEQPPSARTIQYFTVKYRPLGSAASQPQLIRSTSHETTVTGLEPYTYYEFRVRSHDAEGTDGPYSEGRKARTKEGAPSPPLNVTWSPLDASSILVRWLPPRRPHGQLSGYVVLYSADRDAPLDRWQRLDIPASSGTQMQIRQLVPNLKYFLRVRARTAAALGSLSDVAEFEIRAKLISGNPDGQTAAPVDRSTYMIFGVVGGVVAALALLLLLVLWRRWRRPPPPQPRPSGPRPHMNGAAGGAAEHLEMEALTPMLTHVPPAANHHQLDSKGGQPATTKPANGRANGFVHPLYLSTDRLRHGSSEGDANDSRAGLINNNSALDGAASASQQPP